VDKKPIPVCTVCGKRGHNAADCWDKLDADQAKLDVAKANRDKKKADMAKRQPSSKESKAYTAAIASNKALAAAAAATDSDYSACHASPHGCVFDQEFVPHTPGTVLDSGAQVNILEGTLGSGTRIQLTGITGATIEAERADAVFPVIAADGSRHVISIRGKNIVATRTTDNILSLAVLLKAGYKVSFRVGTDLDPTDGGDRYGEKNLYRKRRYICHRRNTNASSMVERYHLQHNFNTLNHSSSHRRSYITNLFSPCPRGSGTTPKTSRSWSRKRTASRVFGTLNAT
jgi:hypothetical protein